VFCQGRCRFQIRPYLVVPVHDQCLPTVCRIALMELPLRVIVAFSF
jgi:hypothetical protein